MVLPLGRFSRHAWIVIAAAIVLGILPLPVGASVVEVRIATSRDDAEEFSDGTMYLGSSDLELIHDATDQTVGMRWPDLPMLHNATITAAWIQFTAKASQSGPTDLGIQADDTDDAEPFTTAENDISSRPRTSAQIVWDPVPWVAGEAGAAERTPDLTSVVQEIVSRPGWAPGSALAIIIHGSGVRTAWAWDGDSKAAPLLHVEYTGGDPPPPPSTYPIVVYAGYYDTHHLGLPRAKPDPWMGSPGVVFAGNPDSTGGWDTCGIRLDNISPDSITDVVVTVDIGIAHFALWGPQTIPANGTLIIAQTGFESFDGSDTNVAGCITCNPSLCMTAVSSTVPRITVRVDSVTTRYYDHDQVLNTGGVDAAGCPYTGARNDESHAWVMVPPEGLVLGSPDSLRGPAAVELDTPVPNPARGSVVFRLRMPVSGDVQMGMYDVAGRLVSSCLDGWFAAGTYLKGLDLTGVQPGVYFGVLRAPGGVAKRAFVVTR